MKYNSWLFSLLMAASFAASAQSVSIGVKGGVSLLEPALRNDESRRYIVGPSVEVQLPAGFALEADALYQRLGSTSSLIFPLSNSPVTTAVPGTFLAIANRQRGNAWEFPLLGKYYFKRGSRWDPFVATGFSFRTVGIESAAVYPLATANGGFQLTPLKSDYRSELGVGAVFAGGLRYKVGRFAVVPEIRYTRWGSSDPLTRRNNVGAFVGLTF